MVENIGFLQSFCGDQLFRMLKDLHISTQPLGEMYFIFQWIMFVQGIGFAITLYKQI